MAISGSIGGGISGSSRKSNKEKEKKNVSGSVTRAGSIKARSVASQKEREVPKIIKPNHSLYSNVNPYRPKTRREVPEIQQPDFVRPSSSGFAGRAQNAAADLQRQAAERRGIQASQPEPVPPQGDLLTQLTFSQLNRSRAARENAAQGKPSFADDAAKALTSLAQKAQEARANGAELPMTGVRAKDYDKTYAQNQRKTTQLDTKLNQLAGALSAEDLSRTYTRQPDFVQASAYVPAAERQRSRGTAYSGVADVVYDYVNGDKKAAATLYDANPAEFTQRFQRYSEASDKDKRVFNYIYNKYGSEAAMEYMDQAEMQFDPAEAFVYNFGQPIMSGIEGVSKLVSGLQPDEPSSRGVPYMPEESESGFDRIYNNYSRDLISAQQQQPIASTAGSIASNVAEMTMIASGIGSLPGFARVGSAASRIFGSAQAGMAAQKILSGAASMAGTHAINEAGAVATGQISGEEYLRDITGAAIRGAAGGAGSIASGMLAGAGLDKLGQIASKFPKLKNNAIARYVAGTAGMVVEGAGFDFAEALTHIGLDPNAYPDAEAFWEDMIIGFAFSAIDYSKGRIADVGRAPVSSFAEINKAKTTEDLAAAAEILRGRYDHAKAEGDFAKAAAFDAQRRDLEADIQAKQDWITWKDNHKAINAYNELKKALHPKRAAAEGAERARLEEAQKRFDEALDRIKKDVDASGRAEETADAIEVLEEIGGRASTAEAESGPRETIINDIAESLSLGENGKAELDAAYDGSDVSTYSREFRDAYQAGREGTALDESAGEVQQRAWQAGRADAEAEAVRGAEASIRPEETANRPNETAVRPEEEARRRFDSLPAEEQARIRKEEDRLRASVEEEEELLRDPKRYGLSDEEITEYQGMLKQDQASLARLEEEYGLLLHEGSERNDGARAGEQGRPVEESTGRDQSWNQEARPEAASRAESANREIPEERVERTWQLDKRAKDRSLSKLTFEDHDTNAAELGLKHGTASGRVRLVKGGETKETKRIYREAARRGISRENVVLFAGGDLSFKEGGVEFGARGAYLGGKIYVRVDDAYYLGSQIAIHEATHHLIATGKLNLDSVRATLAERLGGKEALEEAVALYAQAFEGMDAPADLIFEEMICDAEAGMNHFTYRGEKSAREIDYSYGQIRESVKETTSRGPPAELTSRGVDLVGGSAVNYSRRSWEEADKDAILKGLMAAGFTEKAAKKWTSDGVAAMIAADSGRLDYVSADGHSMLKPNLDYKVTLDASTLCAKRLLYQGTYNAIAHELKNRPMLAEDVIRLRQMMDEAGLESPCGICYVESRRKSLGKFASDWLEGYKGEYIPTLDEVVSTNGLANLKKTHPETYRDFIKAMNKKGVANPKVVEPRAEYAGDIMKMSKKLIETVKRIGGLRVQSFSDFETPHLIDMMQAVIDMARRGLTSQAYTKVPNFAWVFGDTGIKINLSLIGDIDANGKLTFDGKEGMPLDEAMRIRDAYPENVGTILVGKNDAHILAAMADDRIDFIIPFHRSGWKGAEYEALGIKGYKDYTRYQSETALDGSSIKQLYSGDYWDYSKSGKENAEAYLKLCAEQGRVPVFSNFLVNNGDGSWSLQPDGSTDGYWKLLIDFKMYDNNGKGAPQREVVPNFNMEEARRVLSEYQGGANTLPVADEIVKKFVAEYGERHANEPKFSRRSTAELKARDESYQKAVKAGDRADAERMVKQAAVEAGVATGKDGKPIDLYHGTRHFGWTQYADPTHKTPFIYTSTKREVSAHYAGDNNYAFTRDIGQKYEGGSSIDSIIKDAKWVLGSDLKRVSESARAERITKDYKEARRLADQLNEFDSIRYPLSDKVANAVAGMSDPIFTLADSDLTFGAKSDSEAAQKIVNASESEREELKKYLDSSLDYYERGRKIVKEFYDEHRKDLSANDKKYFQTLLSYEMGDAIIDIQYGVRALMDPSRLLQSASGFVDADNIRAAMDQTHDIGAYHLYDELGDKPFEFDANGAQFWALKVPEVSDGYVSTDDVAKWALDNGYSSVIMRNIYDYGDKADNYVFFSPEQIKSADPVTYDDNGNVVPLSERFNPENRDIRFSRRADSEADRKKRAETQKKIDAEYSKTVDDILSGKKNVNDSVLVGYTPEIFRKLGMPDLPMAIGAGHVYSIAKTKAEAAKEGKPTKGVHYHGLGAEAVKRINTACREPIAVIASKPQGQASSRDVHSVVAIIDIGTGGKSRVIPVEITADRKMDGQHFDVNVYSSEYDKTVKGLLEEAIAQENIGEIGIYYAKKEAAQLIGAGVQFPERLQELMASTGIIHQFPEKVNLNVLDQTQTKQFARWFGDWQNAPEAASKVVNADGTPKEMYHGSPDEGFTVFDPKKARAGLYGRGFYFTGDESAAAAYGATSSYYLDIKNPLSPGQHSITRQQMRKFLTEIKNNPDDYDFFNYGENVRIGDVLNQVYGKGDFEALQDINATAIGDMKETIRLFNEVNGTKYDGLILPSETVVFDPTQIKSSTNNVGTFDKSNPDVNFSRRSTIEDSRRETADLQQEVNRGLEQRVKDLQKDLEKQTARANKWKRETRRTPEAEKNKVREADAKRVAGRIVKDYGSKTKAADIAPEIRELSEFVRRGGKGSASDTFAEGMAKARQIAEKVISGAEELVEIEPDADTIRSLIGRTMHIAEKDTLDIPDFEHFRRTMFGKMKLVRGTNGVTVDEAYQELSQMYPHYFPQEITHPADQVLRMADVLETIKPSLENPYSYDYALATEQVAQDIFAGIVAESNNLVQDSALRTNPPTFADKQQARYEQLIAQNKTKTAEQLARVRQQRDAAIKRLKENHTETSARARERRKATELRGQIQKQTKDMASRLLKPTDKKHFLKSVQPLVAQALDAVNMTSAFSYGADGKHVPAGEGDPTGRTKKFIALREQLKSHKEWLIEGTNLLDDGGSLQKLIDMGDKPISQMTSAELQTVHDALRDIDAVVKNADRTFRIGKTESLSASAEKMRADNIGKKPVGEKLSSGARWMHRLLLDMETPENYFHRFGKVGDQMFRELRNAQDKQTKILKESEDFVKANIKVDPRKVAKQKVTVKLGGKDVTTSMAHLMELYNLCRREQGLYHVLEGGVKFSDPKRFQAAAIRNVTTDELSAAFAQLPIEYKQAADALQKYVSGDLAKHGNEASMEVFGYEKFGNDDYWQIKTDASDRKSDETQRQMNLQNTTVANWGSAKALEPNANSAVVIGDVFDSFAESVSGMAGYAANLAVQQDINRLRNWKFYDEEGKRTGTMKELIDQVHGSGGGQYLEKLMADIAGGMKAEAEYFGGLTGRYKGAAVAANMRVILQQPTAIARAAELIGYKYLNEGLVMGTGKGWKKAKQWAPIAQQKEWGSVDVNTGRTVKEILFKNTSPLARTNEFLMSGAAKADAFGWGLLWNACEAETRAKMPDLKVGSDEYYQHVADRFTGIVDHTQVVDGILQRSQIMRNPSSLTKMATSFMGEPIKQFNQLSSAVYDARTSGTPASKKHLAKTARAMLVAGALNAVAQSIWDAVRDDDKTKNYLEKMQSALFGIDGTEEAWTDYMKKFFASNMGDFLNPAGYVPYVKDVVSVLQGYDVERMDLAGISGFVTAAQRMIKAMNGEGKVSTENALIGALGEGARLLGVPLANLKRDVMAVTNTVANETGNYYLQYKIADFNYRQAGNKKEFMDILYGAYKNDSDAYQLIREDLIRRDELASSSKTTEEYIDEQLRKRMNDDGNGISALYDAQKAGGKEYEEKREELVESGIFTDEQIDKGLKAQYKEGGDLDALYKSYSTGSKDFEKQYSDLLKSGVYTEKQLKDEIENRMKEEQGVTSVKDLDERFMMPAAKDAYNKDLAAVQKTSTWTNASASEREKTEKILYDIATGTKTGQKYQEKIDGGKKVGITGTEYATFLLALEVADRRGNANGSHSKDEIQEALESMAGLSQKEKAYLFGTASKAKNNPYN